MLSSLTYFKTWIQQVKTKLNKIKSIRSIIMQLKCDRIINFKQR
jgi:hypothetical protein